MSEPRRSLIGFVCLAVCLFLAGQAHAQTVIAGPNVNMVSGTTWPDGDPFLQRQNEPSIAVSTREAALDVASMAKTSTKIFVIEVMGRHAGWIAAAGGLAGNGPGEPPHIILFPEVPFAKHAFLKRVRECVDRYDYCVIVVSEKKYVFIPIILNRRIFIMKNFIFPPT